MTTHNHQTRSRARLLTNNTLDLSLSLDMNQVGPTRTTATLTPTTLRNIEQTFLEVPEATSGQQIPHQAGFVPPFIPFQAPVVTLPVPQHLQNTNSNHSSHSYPGTEDEELVSAQQSSAHQPMMMNRHLAMVKEDDDMNSMCSDSMSNGSWSEKTTNSTPPPMLNTSGASTGSGTTKTPARRGGRRPNKASNLSPEEQEKRNLRRERNKMAAARCRKRRVDHTNELTEEVEGLEKKKQALQSDIKQLQLKKEELEFLLEAHRDTCSLFGRRSRSPPDVKPQMHIMAMAENIKMEPLDYEAPLTPPPTLNANNDSTSSSTSTSSAAAVVLNNPLMSSASKKPPPPPVNTSATMGAMGKPNRPSSFPAKFLMTPTLTVRSSNNTGDPGIPIQTPSTGIFNFDSLMAGGTGLTPVSGPLVPTSSSAGPLVTGERNTIELATPTSEPAKLVSL